MKLCVLDDWRPVRNSVLLAVKVLALSNWSLSSIISRVAWWGGFRLHRRGQRCSECYHSDTEPRGVLQEDDHRERGGRGGGDSAAYCCGLHLYGEPDWAAAASTAERHWVNHWPDRASHRPARCRPGAQQRLCDASNWSVKELLMHDTIKSSNLCS